MTTALHPTEILPEPFSIILPDGLLYSFSSYSSPGPRNGCGAGGIWEPSGTLVRATIITVTCNGGLDKTIITFTSFVLSLTIICYGERIPPMLTYFFGLSGSLISGLIIFTVRDPAIHFIMQSISVILGAGGIVFSIISKVDPKYREVVRLPSIVGTVLATIPVLPFVKKTVRS